MTQIKKFALSSTAVALAMVVALSMVVSTANAVAPTVVTVAPNTGTVQGGTTVTLTGTQFNNPNLTSVTFNGMAGTNLTIVNGTTATVVTPASYVAGAVNIVVANGDLPDAVGVGVFTYTAVTETVLTVTPSTVPADGSQAAQVRAAVFVNGVLAVGRQVTFSASVGGFGITGTTSTTAFTDSNGVATVQYRGTGSTGTDQIVATTPAPNAAVATANVTVAGAAAGTPSQVVFINTFIAAAAGPNGGVVAASNTTANPNYTSPTTGTNVVFRVTDAAGSGVGNQVLQVTTDKGALVAYNQACSGSAKTITVQTTTGQAFGGTTTTGIGRAAVRVCGLSASAQLGMATITATNITTTMPAVTANVTIAGVPASIATAGTGGALVVNVTDAAGNPVADGTEVMVTVASTVGSVAPASRTTVNGQASFAVALTGTTGNAIVSVNDTASGTLRLTQAVSLTAATGTTPTGDGSLTAPTFGSGNIGNAVFSGGTIVQLAAQVTAAGGTLVWVQDSNGTFRVYSTTAPAFVNGPFNTAFAAGFSGATAVTVVK